MVCASVISIGLGYRLMLLAKVEAGRVWLKRLKLLCFVSLIILAICLHLLN